MNNENALEVARPLTLNLPSRRPIGVGTSLLRLALLSATLSLAAPSHAVLIAQLPFGSRTSHAGAPPPRATMPANHAAPRSGTANVPTPQPHLRSHIGLNLGLGGRWWDETSTMKRLHLTTEQQRRMDSIFETNKPTLISLYLNMQREQTQLSSLPPADLQNQTKVFAAIDRVSQARSDLEKENARILIQIRQQLAPHQLQALDHEIATLQ